jgi:glycerol-3-phosphate dehydrogenase (NAD(P)+)
MTTRAKRLRARCPCEASAPFVASDQFKDQPTTSAMNITVLGAGAWGATLADVLARGGNAVTVWDRDAGALERLGSDRQPRGVPELNLSPSITLEPDFGAAVTSADMIFLVVPSKAIRPVAQEIAGLCSTPVPLVLASKGLDPDRQCPLTEVLAEVAPDFPCAVVSGPCIAREVAAGVPTSLVSASVDRNLAIRVRDAVHHGTVRVYHQEDVVGVELGGALKNVIAVAAGIGDGLGFGANTKAALLTRGLAEMTRLGLALGADPRTLYGLAGLGDLAVTCFSPHSRNRTFGEMIGRGETPEAARSKVAMVVEGEPTAHAASKVASKHGVEMPITAAVVAILSGERTPREAVAELMARDPKGE